MKRHLLTLVIALNCFSSFSQKREEENEGFNWNRVFVGGSLALGYGASSSSYGTDGGSSFVIGANPEIGYSLGEAVDAGLVFNAIYNSIKYTDYIAQYGQYMNIRQTSFNYGAGVFLRLHVFKGFFVQAQPEYNWISYKQKLIDAPSNTFKQTVNAASFLVGAGYGQRIVGQMNAFTVIMFDLGKEKYSPYRDGYNNAVPVIRGGFNFYLGQGKKRK